MQDHWWKQLQLIQLPFHLVLEEVEV